MACAPPNPTALLPGVTGGPALGSTWDPLVDHGSFQPDAVLDLLAIGLVPDNTPSPWGTILCDVPPALLVSATPGSPFSVPVPATCTAVGATAVAQAVSIDALGSIELTNALDLVLGTH